MGLNQTANDCPDCGTELLSDELPPMEKAEEGAEIKFLCPNCGSKFHGMRTENNEVIVQGRIEDNEFRKGFLP